MNVLWKPFMIERTVMRVITPKDIMRMERVDMSDHFAIRYLLARKKESLAFIAPLLGERYGIIYYKYLNSAQTIH